MLTGVPGVIWREGFAGEKKTVWSGVKKKRKSPRGRMTGVIDDADAQTRRPQTSVHPSEEKPRMKHIQLSKL